MDEYQPQGPYILQDGSYQGFSAEQLMFLDYPFLKVIHDKVEGGQYRQANTLHRHLRWLFPRGENRRAKQQCRFCKQEAVTLFSIIKGGDGYSLGPFYTCCDADDCISALAGEANGKGNIFLPLRFSSISYFSKVADQNLVEKLLRQVFNAPKKITRQWAFKFFAA